MPHATPTEQPALVDVLLMVDFDGNTGDEIGLRHGEDEETTARADGKTPLAKAIWQMQWLLTASVRGNES
jgi:hypothetical protein